MFRKVRTKYCPCDLDLKSDGPRERFLSGDRAYVCNKGVKKGARW
jgi:hypothetical protein